jgi:hypothetical protein
MATTAMATELPEYVDNLRALLRLNYGLWRAVVERQILATLLPKLVGNRAKLEAPLWTLLIICLDGHEAPTPACADPAWEQALAAAKTGRGYATPAAAAPFPRAAAGVAEVLVILREVGVFPRPLTNTA